MKNLLPQSNVRRYNDIMVLGKGLHLFTNLSNISNLGPDTIKLEEMQPDHVILLVTVLESKISLLSKGISPINLATYYVESVTPRFVFMDPKTEFIAQFGFKQILCFPCTDLFGNISLATLSLVANSPTNVAVSFKIK